jgi:hypothetical protein
MAWRNRRIRGRKREDKIRIDLEEISCESVDWIQLAHDWDQWRALVNTVITLLVP